MKDIRIGNDILVRWSLYRGDKAYDLTNLPVTLYLKNAYGKKKVENYAVNGNQISWTFYGKDQKNTGKYSMVLVIREGEQGMASTDYCDFVQLVACACQVSGMDDENVQTETLELNSEVDFPPIIVDTSLSEVSGNPIANKAVTAEINKINSALSGKQDKISDLDAIRSGAAKGATALQKAPTPDWNAQEDEAGFIKNKPFNELIHVVIPDTFRHTFHLAKEKTILYILCEGSEYTLHPDEPYSDQVECIDAVHYFEFEWDGNGTLQIAETFAEEPLRELIEITQEGALNTNLIPNTVVKTTPQSLTDSDKNQALANLGITDIARKQELTELSDALTEASSEIEVLAIELESQNEMIADLDNMKIDKEADDYYPNMSVGLADNLAGEDVVASEVSFRRSGGGAISDGTARIKAIKGNSLVWNQLFDKFGEYSQTIQGVTLVDNRDGSYTLTGRNESADSRARFGFGMRFNNTLSHIYLILGCPQGGASSSYWLEEGMFGVPEYGYGRIGTLGNRLELCRLNIVVAEGYEFKSPVTFRPCLYDLTLMFGVGNEPTTIEEFYARIPMGIDLNAYNEGEVIHMDAQNLESVGVNQWDEEWELGRYNPSSGQPTAEVGIRNKNKIRIIGGQKYYCNYQGNAFALFYDSQDNLIQKVSANGLNNYLSIANREFVAPISAVSMMFYVIDITTYNHDICINLSDASVNGKYFPYIKRTQSLSIIGKGLKSAGTAHDEIRYNKATQKWEKVQRIGSVDMGTLNWNSVNEADGKFRYNVQLPSMKTFPSTEIANVLVSLFPTVTGWDVLNNAKEGVAVTGSNYLTIYDKRYEGLTSSEFKAAMQGVMLYYELAEPIVTELEDDFNLDYEVWNGGTEKIVSDVPTTPLKADIAYGFNAVGKIKELEEKIENLPSGESSVFKAVFGETTYEEIKEAYEAGKVVHCDYSNRCYTIANLNPSTIYFDCILGAKSYLLSCSIGTNNWSVNANYTLEQTSNKTKTINEASTDTQYPSAKAVYDFVQSAGTPSGDPMHYMYEAVGAEWNGTGADIEKQGVYGDTITHKAGYWYLNELGDITTEEMRKIYVESNPMVRRLNLEDAFSGSSIRTNIAIWDANRSTSYGSIAHTSSELRGMCYDAQIEVFAFIKGPIEKNIQKHMVFSANSLQSTFRCAEKLSKIIGCILCSNPTDYKTFEDAYLLKEVRLLNLKNSFSFADSPLLSKNSVLFAIQNSAATSAITITLHADAYARLAEDADIVAALAEKTNVSLAK